MADEKMTLYSILKDVRSEVKDRFEELIEAGDDYYDIIHEIADSAVPTYNADIMDVASESHDIMHGVPDIGPAFDGEPTPINIAAANIYEACEAAANEEFERLKKEHEENADAEGERLDELVEKE